MQITLKVGPQEPLLATVKRRKLLWFGHVNRHDSLSKTILQGTVEGERRRGRRRKNRTDNVKEWINKPFHRIQRVAKDRNKWLKISAAASLMSPLCPARARD